MNRGKCPKCGSSNVRRGPRPSAWTVDPGSVIQVGARSVKLRHYVCTSCGFTEAYVADEKDREKLRAKWKLASERDT